MNVTTKVAQALRIIDKDNSGHISYDEFKAWWARKDRFQVLKDEQETQEDAQQWGEVGYCIAILM